MTEQDLVKLRGNVDKAKDDLAQLKGREKQVLSSLKKDWSCASIQAASKMVKKLQADSGKLLIQADTIGEEIEEKYGDMLEL